MKFKWKQFFELICQAFEINCTDIAVSFDVNRSTISNLKNEKTFNFRINNNVIYKRIFDLTYPKSFAYDKYPANTQEEKESSVLYVLKEIIKREGWTDAIKEKSETYESFVMELIKNARSNSSKQSSKGNVDKETPINSPNSHDNGAEISISPQFRKCLCCEYFLLPKTVHKYVTNIAGKCTLEEGKIMPSTNPACDHFQANKGKITREMLTANLPSRYK